MNTIHLFRKWIEYKFKIDTQDRVHQIKQGEVYWSSLGLNVGDEENGKGENFRRPVLILKKFNNSIFLGIPLSTKNKDNPYYVKIIIKDVHQSAMISQIRVMDTKRLDEKIGYISRKDLDLVRVAVKSMIS